ncbi:MAG TPA: hypothetical protein VFA76_16710 [Terriglobales bacterium]|nr:hypothetical protein [Terriglobales bacterium]
MKRRLLLALVLGIAMSGLIGLASHLPYSETRDAITDVLTLPGGFIASLVYPEGVHTGHGAPNWGILTMVSNVIVYVLFWYACLRIIGRIRGRRPDQTPVPKAT